jgi:hypothetical protein
MLLLFILSVLLILSKLLYVIGSALARSRRATPV